MPEPRRPARRGLRRRTGLAAAIAILAAVGGPVRADPRDPVLLPEEEQAAWNAVGRVNVAGLRQRGMCSGTLVAPDLVLTAAHCVTRQGGAAPQPRDVHFVAGWRKGGFAAHRTAADVVRHPDYNPALPPLVERALYDVAFILLADPVPETEIAPLPLADLPETAGTVSVIGYRRDRAHAPSRQSGCAVTWWGPGAIGLDCPTMEGASGAPVLWRAPDGWRVVALVGGAVEGGGATRSLAALVTPALVPPPAVH